MVRVKQFMGFLLLATLLFLALGDRRGARHRRGHLGERVSSSRSASPAGCSAPSPPRRLRATQRSLVLVLILLLVLGSGFYFIGQKFTATKTAASSLTKDGWIAFSPERLQSELAARPHRLHRFHRRLVHHLQIQRSLRPRKRGGEERIRTPRRRENESRLDECRPGRSQKL